MRTCQRQKEHGRLALLFSLQEFMVKYSILAAVALAVSGQGAEAATYTLTFVSDAAQAHQEWITLNYDDGKTFHLSESFTRDTIPNPPVRNSAYQTGDSPLRYALELELSPGWTSIYTSQFAEAGGIYLTYWGQTDASLSDGLSFAGAVSYWNDFTGEEYDSTGEWIVRAEVGQVSAVPLPAAGLLFPMALGTVIALGKKRKRRSDRARRRG
jgi:hypothetical protein